MADDARLAELRGLLATSLRAAGVWWAEDTDGPADRLLPVVSAWAERETARRAAEELREAAEELHVLRFNASAAREARWPEGVERVVPDSFYKGINLATFTLRARAAALTPATEEKR